MQEAWTWEQQAVFKARFVAGDPAIGGKFSAIRKKSLCREHDTEALRREVREMREKMRESLGTREPGQFDVKQDSGGIVDIEFLVQFGVLSRAHAHEKLIEWTDVVRLLESPRASDLSAPTMPVFCGRPTATSVNVLIGPPCWRCRRELPTTSIGMSVPVSSKSGTPSWALEGHTAQPGLSDRPHSFPTPARQGIRLQPPSTLIRRINHVDG